MIGALLGGRENVGTVILPGNYIFVVSVPFSEGSAFIAGIPISAIRFRLIYRSAIKENIRMATLPP